MSKHALNAKGWLIAFAVIVLLLAMGLAAWNCITDPFGAFGDRVFQWWSYDETLNPRVAKFSYLEQHHDEYDSYIIGCSSTSSYPKEQLDRYFGASFYNLIMYGADMLDCEQIADYLVDHYEVKNLVLNVYIDNAMHYDVAGEELMYSMPYQTDGSGALAYYKRYLFAPPSYGLEKLRKKRTDSYVQDVHDVFDPVSGAYDKSRRDVEPIGDMESYLKAYPVFASYDHPPQVALTQGDKTIESVRRIRDKCREKGIRFTVLTSPVYMDYLKQFPTTDVIAFWKGLSEVTDFWDFSLSSVSCDPRFFYDETHFRNCVGEMALARVFGDTDTYVPEDFGVYVTKENASSVLERYRDLSKIQSRTEERKIPILMYHHLADEGDGGDTISVSRFEEHMRALSDNGYTALTLEDLHKFVRQGKDLPEKAVLISFDDGYRSNLELASPILEKYDFPATVFLIGVSAGKDTYKETGRAIIPHFAVEDAAGHPGISLQSHTWDMHQVEGLDTPPVRSGVLPLDGETEKMYIAALREDCARMKELLPDGLTALSYPYGYSTILSRIIFREEGITATFTSEKETPTVIKGIPQSLYMLGRYGMKEDMTGQDLLRLIA